MEPKSFMGYPKRGNACQLNSCGHEQYPSNSINQIIESMVFIDYPKEGIAFLISFGMACSSLLFDACKTMSQPRRTVVHNHSFVFAKLK